MLVRPARAHEQPWALAFPTAAAQPSSSFPSPLPQSLHASTFSFSAPVAPALRGAAPQMAARAAGETQKDLVALAEAQKIPMGFWDPLGFSKLNLWDKGESGTIGWLRHAEIKHGRVAMAGFVGFCLHANGIVFPWAIQGGPLSEGTTKMFADIAAAGSPLDQWDVRLASAHS